MHGGHQASASAIRTMALGASNSSWFTPIQRIPGFIKKRFQSGAEMGSFSIEKAKKSLQGARVTQGAFGSNGRGQSGSMTEGILIATELAGFAHPGGDVPPKHRLHRSTIPFPPLQTKCRDGTMLQEYYIDLYFIIYKSEHVTHHARKVHCFAQSISDVERSGKKYSVRSTTLSPPGCLSSNLSGRREGSVLPFFFVHFHLQR